MVEGTAGSGRLRRSRPPLLRVALGASLAAVIAAPELAAWHGLVGFARDELGLANGWEYLVPLLFGAAAAYCALLAVRHVLAGDSAVTERALTWIYALAGAGFNVHHAAAAPSAVFFGGASVSAALLWDRTLRAWRRDELRAIGALERPLPRFRVLRWLVAPRETWTAWTLAIREGITSPIEALARARAVRGAPTADLPADVTSDPHGDVAGPAAAEQAEVSAEPAPELAGKSKSQVIVERLIGLGVDFDRAADDDDYRDQVRNMVPDAWQWAAEHGVPMHRGQGYDAFRREVNRRKAALASQRRLRPVAGGGGGS